MDHSNKPHCKEHPIWSPWCPECYALWDRPVAPEASARADVRSINGVDARRVKMTAMAIVNYTLETAGVSAEKRQAINDRCDDHAVSELTKLLSASTDGSELRREQSMTTANTTKRGATDGRR